MVSHGNSINVCSWTLLSQLSLGELSTSEISVFELPIYPSDIWNAEYYDFSNDAHRAAAKGRSSQETDSAITRGGRGGRGGAPSESIREVVEGPSPGSNDPSNAATKSNVHNVQPNEYMINAPAAPTRTVAEPSATGSARARIKFDLAGPHDSDFVDEVRIHANPGQMQMLIY